VHCDYRNTVFVPVVLKQVRKVWKQWISSRR
jgi:hypothetical protein